MVVMSSYAGLPGGTALEGLYKQSCSSNGLKGGVIRLVFISAFLVPEGFQYPLAPETIMANCRGCTDVSILYPFQSNSPDSQFKTQLVGGHI